LIPDRWATVGNVEGVVGNLASNAAGDAYFVEADSEATITGRGWVTGEQGGGSSGKASGGDPWILQSSYSSGTSQGHLTFDGTATDQKYLLVAKIQVASACSSDRSDNTACFLYSYNKGTGRTSYQPHVNLCNGAGTAARYAYCDGSTDRSSSGITIGTGAHWISVFSSPTASDILQLDRIDGRSGTYAVVSEMATLTVSEDRLVKWFVSATASIYDSTLKVFECHIFEVS